jgi:hypothetical protein
MSAQTFLQKIKSHIHEWTKPDPPEPQLEQLLSKNHEIHDFFVTGCKDQYTWYIVDSHDHKKLIAIEGWRSLRLRFYLFLETNNIVIKGKHFYAGDARVEVHVHGRRMVRNNGVSYDWTFNLHFM